MLDKRTNEGDVLTRVYPENLSWAVPITHQIVLPLLFIFSCLWYSLDHVSVSTASGIILLPRMTKIQLPSSAFFCYKIGREESNLKYKDPVKYLNIQTIFWMINHCHSTISRLQYIFPFHDLTVMNMLKIDHTNVFKSKKKVRAQNLFLSYLYNHSLFLNRFLRS